MVKQAVATRTTDIDIDLDPIDRLEQKVKRLVEMIAQLRAEQTRSIDENARLLQEIEALRARVADAERTGTEVAALRDERDMIRTRVADMLEQLEAI